MKSFGSDNHSGIHPQVLDAITRANYEHATAYGDDQYTELAISRFKHIFGQNIEVFFAFNGTGANCLSLLSASSSFNSIICVDTAHINVDECGAPEKLTGCKLVTIPNVDGKLTVEMARTALHGFNFEHHCQPRVISITQSTELGTLYTLDEIRALSCLAHSHNMYLHIDGARFANAVVSLGCTPAQMVQGCDILSFGGTKNGMMIGEAVVILNPELAHDFKYKRKQSMQLCSKMRFISAQFIGYFQDDLWLTLARHSCKMARLLAHEIEQCVTISRPVESNALFAVMPSDVIQTLQKEYFFYVWDESTNEVRLMCSFDTTEQDVMKFANAIKDAYSR